MTHIHTDKYSIWNADTVEVARALPSKSVGFSIFSPPFSSLYTYSNSPRDMGNVRDDAEFWGHYRFLITEQARVMRPCRLIAIHCMQLPTSKERDGHIGLRDFRGDIIREYERAGFIYHSEVVIWKDPVTAVQRTKAHGLLHKTVRTNASMSRQGIPDYLVVMRSPGEPDVRVTHDVDEYPVALWQRVASPVWVTLSEEESSEVRKHDSCFLVCSDNQRPNDPSSGIDAQDTLQYQSAREHDDERHICPLQLEVIRRGVRLWTNPGDVVWSPFMGIGSEGYVALQEGRRFIGAELKASYFRQAAENLKAAAGQLSLFDGLSEVK